MSSLENVDFAGVSRFSGTMRLPANIIGEFGKDNLNQRVLEKFPLALQDWRVWDAIQTPLPNPSAGDDLGLYQGALPSPVFGTDTPEILSFDIGSVGAVTLRARYPDFVVPDYYESGETIQLAFFAGCETTIADTAATIDVEVFKSSGDGVVSGSDRYTGAALDIRSITFAEMVFDLGTGLVPGDHLDIRVTIAANDGGNSTVVQVGFGKAELQCDTR